MVRGKWHLYKYMGSAFMASMAIGACNSHGVHTKTASGFSFFQQHFFQSFSHWGVQLISFCGGFPHHCSCIILADFSAKSFVIASLIATTFGTFNYGGNSAVHVQIRGTPRLINAHLTVSKVSGREKPPI